MIEKLIKLWVRENYGENEAEEPSWNIEALSYFLEKQLGMDFESKKKRIYETFMDNLRTFQRVNEVAHICRDLLYDEKGNHTADGVKLYEYLVSLNEKAKEIEEREPDYSELKEI